MSAIEGGCLCGACRYETDAVPINVRACHCRICQKATGAPFYARVMVPLDAVRLAGPIGWYHSSDEVRRGFCTRCGALALGLFCLATAVLFHSNFAVRNELLHFEKDIAIAGGMFVLVVSGSGRWSFDGWRRAEA